MRIIDVITNATQRPFKLIGNVEATFNALSPVAESGRGDITWIKSGTNGIDELLAGCYASCVICSDSTYQALTQKESFGFIITERPEWIFHDLLKYFWQQNLPASSFLNDIHPTAIINANCKIGKNVVIGAYSIIDEVEIGDNVVIGNNVRIFSNVNIGNNCLIREFCSIGGQGFGFIKSEQNTYEHMPHIGKVIIEDDVQIFPFSNVDRATLSVTRISKGVRIDHYCHIGHNCSIGNNTVIAAQVVTSGGVKIGSNCFIGVNTVVREKLVIGNAVTTGLSSVVTKNIPDNETWVGNPAGKFQKK